MQPGLALTVLRDYLCDYFDDHLKHNGGDYRRYRKALMSHINWKTMVITRSPRNKGKRAYRYHVKTKDPYANIAATFAFTDQLVRAFIYSLNDYNPSPLWVVSESKIEDDGQFKTHTRFHRAFKLLHTFDDYESFTLPVLLLRNYHIVPKKHLLHYVDSFWATYKLNEKIERVSSRRRQREWIDAHPWLKAFVAGCIAMAVVANIHRTDAIEKEVLEAIESLAPKEDEE